MFSEAALLFAGSAYNGSLRGRAGTQFALRNRLPGEPAFSVGRVHGYRLSILGTVGAVVPAALDPVRMHVSKTLGSMRAAGTGAR
jgi:hypothetical protein